MKTKYNIEVELKPSKISGIGLFALQDIEWGTRIAEYTGEIVSNKEYEKRTIFYDKIGVNYLFDLSETETVDGLVGGNETRFINHSNKKPNLNVMRENGKIYFYSADDIQDGDELVFDYGKNFRFKTHPHE